MSHENLRYKNSNQKKLTQSKRDFQDELMINLIRAEALKGNLYTANQFAEKFAYIKADEYDWPKNFKWQTLKEITKAG
jgi:hypothetical protein